MHSLFFLCNMTEKENGLKKALKIKQSKGEKAGTFFIIALLHATQLSSFILCIIILTSLLLRTIGDRRRQAEEKAGRQKAEKEKANGD